MCSLSLLPSVYHQHLRVFQHSLSDSVSLLYNLVIIQPYIITMYHSKLVSVLLIISFVLNLCTGATIYPKSLQTQKGSSSTVPISALQTLDQSGSQDSWNKYVEFYGMTFSLSLPLCLSPLTPRFTFLSFILILLPRYTHASQ